MKALLQKRGMGTDTVVRIEESYVAMNGIGLDAKAITDFLAGAALE